MNVGACVSLQLAVDGEIPRHSSASASRHRTAGRDNGTVVLLQRDPWSLLEVSWRKIGFIKFSLCELHTFGLI
jgi:hypothetical protein